MGYQSEAQLENLLIQRLKQQDFNEVKIEDYDRLVENFKEKFSLFNADKLKDNPLTDKEWQRVMNDILGRSVFGSAKKLRDKVCIKREDETDLYLDMLNTTDISKNIFEVTHQTTVIGKYTNRYDVTLLINGLPIVQIELKRRGMDIKEAFNQIERYRKHSYQGLYRYIQIFVITNGVDTKYFANSDRNILYSYTFFWTNEKNERITNLNDFTQDFLTPSHLIKMISKFTVLNDTDKVLIIMRPYQVYAAEALVRRATETNLNAYVWHTTGSGKTLTSFKVAEILSHNPKIKKVFFLVDRKDLDSQTVSEFNKFAEGSVDTTDKTSVLVKQIKDKNTHLIVTTIQKMARAITNSKYESVMSAYKDEKVVFIIDECHRSQFGQMHKDIVKFFTKAQFFGFTGTPRFKENASQDKRTTADLFDKCVHSYLIKEAINDNNVLGFHVEYISTFDGQYDEYDDTMVEGIDTKEVYMADERISLVANHIIQNHNMKTQNRKYTAIFATESIDALIKYYDEFKSIDHDLKIAAIFSYGANEESEGKDEHSRDALERIIADYNKMFRTNYSTNTFNAYNTDISKKVKSKQIDILIVVNMYLTGFDSKPLNTLYVDKWLKYHDLLQAFSRTNRVEEQTKVFGNIVCYRNLKKRTDEAICLFSQTNSVDDVLMKDYDYYLDRFNDCVQALYTVAKTPSDVDSIQSEEEKRKFILIFKEISKLLLILKTFVEFSFDKEKMFMSEQTYEDFKSKYYLIYDQVKRQQKENVSILNDIDFSIELMETDRINVAYIMNLIRSIEFTNKEQKEKDIDHILSELDRADNPELRKKVDLIKAFLEQVVPDLSDGSEVDEAYIDFEDTKRNQEIEAFTEKEDLDIDFVKEQISEYEFTGIINKDDVRNGINRPLPFLKKKKLTERIIEFIKDLVNKFQ